MLITFVLCVLLFMERFTGEIPHAIFGMILTVLLGIHTWRQMPKMKYKNRHIRLVDRILLISLAILLITGILVHPLHDILLIRLLHKLSAVIFVPGLMIHIVQHAKKARY